MTRPTNPADDALPPGTWSLVGHVQVFTPDDPSWHPSDVQSQAVAGQRERRARERFAGSGEMETTT